MCGNVIRFQVCVSLFLCYQLLGSANAQSQDRIRIAPASDGVELERIEIVRCSARGAVKEADLTNMEIRLWLGAAWNREGGSLHHLIRLHSLSAIEDDTGKLLSTKERLQHVHYLRGEVRGDVWTSSGKEGPEIRLILEAPARRAEKLKVIKGKAEVSLAKAVNLTFSDLAIINGKELAHPDLKALKDLKIRFSIEEKDGRITATLKAPVHYANLGRLYKWDVLDGKRPISLFSQSVTPNTQEGAAVTKTYSRRTFKELSLNLIALDPVESKNFNFEFSNIELP